MAGDRHTLLEFSSVNFRRSVVFVGQFSSDGRTDRTHGRTDTLLIFQKESNILFLFFRKKSNPRETGTFGDVITGAASGIGKAIAIRCGKARMRVILVDVEAP